MSRKEILTSFPDREITQIDWKTMTISASLFKRDELPFAAGSFGGVYKGVYKNEPVIIKQFQVSHCFITQHSLDEKSLEKSFKREAEIMFLAQQASEHVVSLKAVCFEKENYSLIMELLPKHSLRDLLDNDQDLPWKLRYQIALDVCSGLADIHAYKIIHGDIKSFNIVLDNNLRAKLIDFGSSGIEDEDKIKGKSVQAGTLKWMPPEMVAEGVEKSLAADIYSFGVVLWELASRELPYKTKDKQQTSAAILTGKTEEIPKHCPGELKSIMQSCWLSDPHQRPTGTVVATRLKTLVSNPSSTPSSAGIFSLTPKKSSTQSAQKIQQCIVC